MPASTAVHSYGTTLSVSDTSGGSYTALAEVVDVNEDETVGSTKVTNLSSPSAAHEYIAGLIDSGECTFMLNFTKAQLNTIVGYRRLTKYWKVTLADGSVIAFAGFVTKRGTKVPDDDRITCDFTIKRSGIVTFTPAA